jgi:hypothetical protein
VRGGALVDLGSNQVEKAAQVLAVVVARRIDTLDPDVVAAFRVRSAGGRQHLGEHPGEPRQVAAGVEVGVRDRFDDAGQALRRSFGLLGVAHDLLGRHRTRVDLGERGNHLAPVLLALRARQRLDFTPEDLNALQGRPAVRVFPEVFLGGVLVGFGHAVVREQQVGQERSDKCGLGAQFRSDERLVRLLPQAPRLRDDSAHVLSALGGFLDGLERFSQVCCQRRIALRERAAEPRVVPAQELLDLLHEVLRDGLERFDGREAHPDHLEPVGVAQGLRILVEGVVRVLRRRTAQPSRAQREGGDQRHSQANQLTHHPESPRSQRSARRAPR